jgi:hypothetical protein
MLDQPWLQRICHSNSPSEMAWLRQFVFALCGYLAGEKSGYQCDMLTFGSLPQHIDSTGPAQSSTPPSG